VRSSRRPQIWGCAHDRKAGPKTGGVHHSEPLPSAAIAWAERQAGVLTRAQLINFGLHDSQVARLVRQQVLRRLDRGIYILGVLEPTWHQYAWAAVLLGGRSARLMGASAAVFEGLANPSLPILVSVDSTSGLMSRHWLTVVRQRSTARPPGSLTSPPRTLIEDTVLDMCSAASNEADVIGFLTLSIPRLTNSSRLARALGRRSRIAHRGLIADIVAETAVGVQSPLEFRWMKQVERPHRLPIPTRPYRLRSGAVADGAYEEFRVLLELDGWRYHDGERRFRDWRRDNLSSEDGWLTLRYGWHDTVIESCATAGNLVRVLRRRGYDGDLAPCTHCSV
jgi:Transcriptional regulator, AbiEi antitoxin